MTSLTTKLGACALALTLAASLGAVAHAGTMHKAHKKPMTHHVMAMKTPMKTPMAAPMAKPMTAPNAMAPNDTAPSAMSSGMAMSH